MSGRIELIAFMGLRQLFKDRGWSIPHFLDVETDMAGEDFLRFVSIDSDKVESFIINRSAIAVEDAVIHPGDRVALVPPGVPGPHRLLLGIHGQTKPEQPFGLSFAKSEDGGEGEEQ
ncbi:hypothetical protein [Pleomorphomonas sp. JP5]|uniref:hypothetical protein n=1 Tax=Pleomorphomonas sp. JP5 TaxID=2942998 RepID=UPI0020430521|nr:hypothetical protein [Pleomorphomonas sp. JP5]MCM5560082.1 hypothetical protein [Pleomorphomonas sp. JP5]